LLWEWDDLDTEKIWPRVLLFEFAGADPILLKRSAVLVEGLETRKCHALQQLPGSMLVELKDFVKQR
jgi:hypothetical protein